MTDDNVPKVEEEVRARNVGPLENVAKAVRFARCISSYFVL